MSIRPLILVFALAAAPAAQFGAVHVVDETGAGGAFTDLQTAVVAAADGDLILVRDGTYAGLSLQDRALTIMADDGASPLLTGVGNFVSLDPGETLVVSGLRFSNDYVLASMGVTQCAGALILQDCTFEYLGSANPAVTIGLGAIVQQSLSVTMVDCTFDSLVGASPLEWEHGFSLSETNAYFYGTRILAGTGYDAVIVAEPGKEPVGPGGSGGDAFAMGGGFAFFSDCELAGGPGGNATAPPEPEGPPCQDGGPGGVALVMDTGTTSAPSVVALDTVLSSGAGGAAAGACQAGPPPPSPVEQNSGVLEVNTQTARTLSTRAVVRVGEPLAIDYAGEPFDFLWLMYAPNARVAPYDPAFTGTLHPGTPFKIRFRGILNAQGTKTDNLTIAPTGLPFVPLVLQALHFEPGGPYALSNPRVVAVLD